MPFTPGPWFALGNTVFADNDGTICHVDRSNPDRADNLRLIAAAPSMLSALQSVAKSPDCARAVAEYEAVLAAISEAINSK